jgi:hypothetical protein
MAGIICALEKTNSDFIICVSPVGVISNGAIDKMIARLNSADVDICSGFDARKAGVSADDFDSFEFQPKRDYMALNSFFFGMRREVAEEVSLDVTYVSKDLLDIDTWNFLKRKNLIGVSSQNILFYSFDVDWKKIETEKFIEEDRLFFKNKWGFLPE